MAFELLPERLWERIQPLLPPEKPAGTRGRPPVTNKQALTGILFVLHTGCPWNMIPKELGCGSGSTCFRRFQDWTERGIWQEVHRVLLDELGECDAVDHSWAAIDSASVRAVFGGITPARIPRTDPRPVASAT